MITIDIYDNGVEINGHSRADICGEVSIMIWNIMSMISSNGANSNYEKDIVTWYSSANHNQENPNEGRTLLLLEELSDEGQWMFEEYIINMSWWASSLEEDGIWEKGSVVINCIDNKYSGDIPEASRRIRNNIS